MGIGIPDMPHINHGSQPRWDRCERADLFAQYRAWRTQGISERQAAQERKVPRTPLQAWRLWHDPLDSCPPVAEFLQSGPGLAFLHRWVIAFHLPCVEVGACGICLGCLFLTLTGLDRFVAAAYGAQQPVNSPVEHAIVTYRHSETACLAQAMPHKDLTVPQDATFPGGLCLVTMAPDSHCILVEQSAQARAHTTWHARMAPALAPLNGRVIQSTRDDAPGVLADVEHSLAAHHSPDVLHGQPELVKAVSGPTATKARAAPKAISAATAQLERLQTHSISPDDEPAERGPGRPPKAPVSLEQAAQALAAACREPARLAAQRAQVQANIRGMGPDDHFVDLERGMRRNGRRMASDSQEHIEQIRTVAQQEGRSPSCWERIETAERVGPKRQATIEFVARYVTQQVKQLD